MRMICFAFYRSNFSVRAFNMRRGERKRFKPLQVNRKSAVGIILGKTSLGGSIKLNYKPLGVLPAKQL